MIAPKQEVTEAIQRIVARLLARSPAGVRLCLIGGFRYRLLNKGARVSMDIDYHWVEDLAEKQRELISIFERRLLPEVHRQLGYDGSVRSATGSDADSPVTRVVELAFWQEGVPYSRIELPVEITRIPCMDRIKVKTMDGVAYPTASDLDMIESKVIAVFNRTVLQHRDLVDIFLFADHLESSSPFRIEKKLRESAIEPEDVQKRLNDLEDNRSYHSRAISEVIDTQVESDTATNLNAGGGGDMVLEEVMGILRKQVSDFLAGAQ